MKYEKCSITQLKNIIKNATHALRIKESEQGQSSVGNGNYPFTPEQVKVLEEQFQRKEKQR